MARFAMAYHEMNLSYPGSLFPIIVPSGGEWIELDDF